MGLQAPKPSKLSYRLYGEKDKTIKNWYLGTYKKSDGIYSDALVLCDSEEQA